jgi:hypothetical protein
MWLAGLRRENCNPLEVPRATIGAELARVPQKLSYTDDWSAT